MKSAIQLSLSLGLLVTASISAHGASTQAADAITGPSRTPVLLELFTSEGCSSCPSADKLLQSLDKNQPFAGANLIVLSEHVDYWNNGGWSDPYSSADFTHRQSGYANQFGDSSVYTPELVVDGTTGFVGSNAVEARSAITKAAEQSKLPITLSSPVRDGNRVSVHLELPALQSGKGTIYLALADNEDRSQVASGENAGRSLTHVAVVRTLTPVGTLGNEGFSKDVTVPFKFNGRSGLRVVAFVQDQVSHKVLAVGQEKL